MVIDREIVRPLSFFSEVLTLVLLRRELHIRICIYNILLPKKLK